MAKKLGVVRFLGTNCDRDVWQAGQMVGLEPEWLWYQDRFDWQDYLAIVIPGGFSYGDYLRSGALAARAAVMSSVREAALKGVPVLGICNGFQILCESGLLPGALVRNQNLRFIDEWVGLTAVGANPHWGGESLGDLHLPIAHGDGRYFCDESTLKELEDKGQIWLQYAENPNGSVANIAGVMNKNKTVAGLMPHPERAVANWMGSEEGQVFFTSLI